MRRVVAIGALVGLWVHAAVAVDHADLVQALDQEAVKRGRAIYQQNCMACHGADAIQAAMPQARSLAQDRLKQGVDPYGMWQTLDKGLGLMPAVTYLDAAERYDVIHYIRETFLKGSPAAQYRPVSEAYIEELRTIKEPQPKPLVPLNDGMVDVASGANMDYGPCLHHSVTIGKALVPRALSVRVGDLTVCYDLDRARIAGAWPGDLLNLDQTHYRKNKGKLNAQAGGPVLMEDVKGKTGWQGDNIQFHGRMWSGDRVVIASEVNGRLVYETPAAGTAQTVVRSLTVMPGEEITYKVHDRMAVTGAAVDDGMVRFPATSTQPQHVTIVQSMGTAKPVAVHHQLDVAEVVSNPQRLWPQDVVTQGRAIEEVGAYASDELTLPYRNPYGAWMRPASIAHFSDGRVAIGTWSGDVWVVDGAQGALGDLRWRRVMAGLYEPLGMLIIDDVIHVRARDGIYRLEDRNNDGEMDALIAVYNEPDVLPAYNSFIFGLEQDHQGRFYFAKAGFRVKNLGLETTYGRLVRLDPATGQPEVLATGLREPNGLGVAPDGSVIVSDNQGQWIPGSKLTRIADDSVPFCGYSPSQFGRDLEQGFYQPFMWIPHYVDGSTGQPLWAPEAWGPHGGQMLYPSYSTGVLIGVLTQETPAGWNGFSFDYGLRFATGVIRGSADHLRNQVYVAGLIGYDYRGKKNGHQGALYRVRVADDQAQAIVGAAVHAGQLELQFSQPLAQAVSTKQWTIEAWNYRWSKIYGSKDYLLADDSQPGRTQWSIDSVKRVDDRTLLLSVPDLAICDQFELTFQLPGGFEDTLYGTVNVIPE